MEDIQKNTPESQELQLFIENAFKEKKGRSVYGNSPFTGYITLNSPEPSLPALTAAMLEGLLDNPYNALTWTSFWDKSIISVAPDNSEGFQLLSTDDKKGKSFVPVSTTRKIDSQKLISNMPEVGNAIIAVNSKPMTIDAFLIAYFHLVNEHIWDLASEIPEKGVNLPGYKKALNEVCEKGFSVRLMSEKEIIETKKRIPQTSVRIYGSKVSSEVPAILGAVIPI